MKYFTNLIKLPLINAATSENISINDRSLQSIRHHKSGIIVYASFPVAINANQTLDNPHRGMSVKQCDCKSSNLTLDLR